MDTQMYVITEIDTSGDIVDRYYTDDTNLKRALYYKRIERPHHEFYVNKAVMCFDGYLVNGDYCPVYTKMEITGDDI